MLITACGTKQETAKEEQTNNNTQMELKNVNGRDDMGAKLYVTPQAALMTATYDGEGNADVMTAARGGQQEGNEEGFQLSSHKTTENIRFNKVFFHPLSFADARTAGGERLRRHGRRPRGEGQGGPEYENAGMRECVNSLIR